MSERTEFLGERKKGNKLIKIVPFKIIFNVIIKLHPFVNMLSVTYCDFAC